jgi:DNA repair exonuclease SbcCD ATPase subunit
MIQVSQAAINRAVRDLLSLSEDQETLGRSLDNIPRNSASATRAFADEQQLLLRGAERVRDMLSEVAKDTPLMDSQVGRNLGAGISSMKGAAEGLESGAVHLANDEGDEAVQQLNAVAIQLLLAADAMSSCSSGMPMSSLMQELKELSGDQDKLNQALKKLREQGGTSMDRRLRAQMDSLAQEQRRIQQQLEQMLQEMGSSRGLLGRLDDVSQKLDEVAKKLGEGKLDDQTLREQEWALTRLLDSQRSMRERDQGRERQSRPGDEAELGLPPSVLPEGLEGAPRDLREDLLKALERRYPPKYEDLIRRYFRELSREAPAPDLP